MEVIHVCWIKDKRLGHLTKVEGVLKALRYFFKVEVEEIEVHWWPRFLRTAAAILPKFMLNCVLSKQPETTVDLIVSAGGATEWPNAQLSKRLGVPNIYIGSCRTCSEEDFAVLPRFEGESERILILDIDSSKIDVETANKAAESELSQFNATYWAVLIGGDCAGCKWSVKDWEVQANRIVLEAIAAKVQLLVTTSPRTGSKVESIWRKILENSDVLAYGIWFNEQGSENAIHPSLPSILGKSDRVIVTEDSVTMVNEAVASGRPVATISPRNLKLNRMHEEMLIRFEQNNRIIRLKDNDWQFADYQDNHWRIITPRWHYEFGQELVERLFKK